MSEPQLPVPTDLILQKKGENSSLGLALYIYPGVQVSPVLSSLVVTSDFLMAGPGYLCQAAMFTRAWVWDIWAFKVKFLLHTFHLSLFKDFDS